MNENEKRLREWIGQHTDSPNGHVLLELALGDRASAARAEALEEAAVVATSAEAKTLGMRVGLHIVAGRIRALIGATPPASIPVETVRGVLGNALSLDDDGRPDFDEGWACAIIYVSGKLAALGMPGAPNVAPTLPSIPAKRVREVLDSARRIGMIDDASHTALLARLGVPLDGAGEQAARGLCDSCGWDESAHKPEARNAAGQVLCSGFVAPRSDS